MLRCEAQSFEVKVMGPRRTKRGENKKARVRGSARIAFPQDLAAFRHITVDASIRGLDV